MTLGIPALMAFQAFQGCFQDFQENCPISEHICEVNKADSLCARPGHGELSKVLHLLSDDLNASFIRGIELQHPLSVQLRTGGDTEDGLQERNPRTENR